MSSSNLQAFSNKIPVINVSNALDLNKEFKKLNYTYLPSKLGIPINNLDARTGWLAFPLTIKNNLIFTRKDLQIFFEKNNIQTRTIFTGNILKQPAMKGLKYKSQKDCSNISDYAMKYGILLGCHHGMNNKDLTYITKVFLKFLKSKKII